MQKVLIAVLLSCMIVNASGNKHINKPQSDVVSIESITPWYIGFGSGWSRLTDSYSKEYFEMTPGVLIGGYTINDYISIEGRYAHNISNVKYDGGNSPNNNQSDFDTEFEYYAIYSKITYPIDISLAPYILLGYGWVSLSNIKGSKRTENSLQYGVGITYQISLHTKVFADYTRLYDDKGFDGRAKLRDVYVDTIILGVQYAF
jgi:opacity protein-like surface antigen